MKVLQNLWNKPTLEDKEKIKKTPNLTLNGYYKKSKDFINNNFLINEEGNKEIDVILSDTYDFHFTNTNGERFDNNTFKDIIKKQLNEAGLYFEVNGKGKPFDWDMHLKLIIPK